MSSRKSNMQRHLSQQDVDQGLTDPFGDMGNFMQPFRQMEEAMSSMHSRFFGEAFGGKSPFDNAFDEMDRVMQAPPQDGSTQYYCSSTCTRILPDGVVETKKQTRCNDFEQKEHFKQLGDKRMIGRYEKNLKTGQEDIRRDLYNMEEDEIDQFQRDFDTRAQSFQHRLADRSWQPSKPSNSHKALK